MPCVLWVSGDFTTEELKNITQMTPYKNIEKGSIVQTAEGEKKYDMTLCGFDVSDKDFTDLKAQVGDAISYLETHFNQLQKLSELQSITARLDFGFFTTFMDTKVVAQYDTLPFQLLRLAGNLKIDIELSQFWHSEQK